MMRLLFCSLVLLLMLPASVYAGADSGYAKAMQKAAIGHDAEAVAILQALSISLEEADVWKQRAQAASELLQMRARLVATPDLGAPTPYMAMAAAYAKQTPLPAASASWVPGVIGAIVPGAGHAWQGRWRDAGVAAMLVWPMLFLTFWAARRRMGPVTVFFALISMWLWSGSVFSAVSLAERGDMEAYLVWWQGMWQASGLPGRPW